MQTCSKPLLITVTNLVPSARVILYEDGTPLTMTDTAETTLTFYPGPFKPHSILTARMQLCRVDGPLSKGIPLIDDSSNIDMVVAKLYECSAYIGIWSHGGLYDGKVIHAESEKFGVLRAYKQVFSTIVLLGVSPSLVTDDSITIVVQGCGGATTKFGPYKVNPIQDGPHVLAFSQYVHDGDTAVYVDYDYSGATIRVYVDNVMVAQQIANGGGGPIILPKALKVNQQVYMTQSLCNLTSPKSAVVTVLAPLPLAPLLFWPANNYAGVSPQDEIFAWGDPGPERRPQLQRLSYR